jgi:hypothetical protein
MQFFAMLIVALVVFAFCFAVFLLKGRKGETEPRLHACGQGEDCRCYGPQQRLRAGGNGSAPLCHEKGAPEESFDLLTVLEKAKTKEDSE